MSGIFRFAVIMIMITTLSSVLGCPVCNAQTYNSVLVENKIKTLLLHRKSMKTPATPFTYTITELTPAGYQSSKPAGSMTFDAGYVTPGGNIFISTPETAAQKAIFKNIDQVALFYVCQAFLRYYYQSEEMPIWFSYGFCAYEAHLEISDDAAKNALVAYGGSIGNFSLLNQPASFEANNGIALAYMFGEFISAYHCWDYQEITNVTANTIEVAPWWNGVATIENLLAIWNRYLNKRLTESDSSLRLKLGKVTDHFNFYYRDADSFNFPMFSDTLETAYTEYTNLLDIQALERLTVFTMPECEGALINGVPCSGRLTGGTAWSSGINTSCAVSTDQLAAFAPHIRHELAHVMQGLIPQGTVSAWMNEGFPGFYEARGPISAAEIAASRQAFLDAMNGAINYFGHRPTFAETFTYPSSDNYYDYYTMGWLLVDFMYRRGGNAAIKDIFRDYKQGIASLGYSSEDDFLRAFYTDFDLRIAGKSIVTLTNPKSGTAESGTTVNISWVPLDAAAKLNVYVSTGLSGEFTEIAASTTATSVAWNAPAGYTGPFRIKFTSPEFGAESILGPFIKSDMNSLLLMEPQGGTIHVPGDTIKLLWAETNIPNINVEFSSDGGLQWSIVKSGVSAAVRSVSWVVPAVYSDKCLLRVTNATDNNKSSTMLSPFRVTVSDPVGGPYAPDNNTVVLLHFNGNLENESDLTTDAEGYADAITYKAGPSSGFGEAIKTSSPLSITHCPALNLTGSWTIEAWVYIEAFTTENSNQYIVTKPGDADSYNANYTLQINTWWDNKIYGFYFPSSGVRNGVLGSTIPTGQWYHLAFIRDAQKAEMRLIIRNSTLAVVSDVTQAFTTGTDMLTSSRNLVLIDGIKGFVDELRISNIVRPYAKPAVPGSPEPADNSTGVASGTQLTLRWKNGDGSVSDDLYLGTTNPPSVRYMSDQVMASEYLCPNLLPGTKYYWQVIAKNGAGNTNGPVWSFTTATGTGINDQDEEKLFNLWPVPASGSFFVQTGQITGENAVIKITDAAGKLVRTVIVKPLEKTEVPLKGFAPGYYIVTMYQHNGKTLTHRLVVR
ncbi:MAG TPA: T9SS type A sorting domain-containing protein [Bacteroidales bacterium]|nr:T9SS type A sorting domain-containing protein [Bacteroidales bacterium]HPT11208.1 T9SS type A sorting domain-containing protein [Bacteroidales bacterium]